MASDITISHTKLAEFGAYSPKLVASTSIANVWKVKTVDYGLAALKIYHQKNMRNEAPGFEVLKAARGVGAINIYRVCEASVLMEWLDGPSLGDMVRSGRDEQAAMELVKVANKLHRAMKTTTCDLPSLEDWFDGVFELRFSDDVNQDVKRNFNHCRRLADKLLSSQYDITPLHGDLHHDNIKLGARGFTSFDAKGVRGERTYELANAFRNPKGAERLVYDPQRMEYLATIWAREFDVDRERLLKWAAVKCAWSISKRSKGLIRDDDELVLLDRFIKAVEA
jgi:streptomycin 6-kinase